MAYEPDIIVSLIARIREKANRFLAAELERHGLNGLKPIHGDLLLALFRNEAPTMKELTELVDRKKSTVTTLVEKLVRLGYAEKRQDESDSRVYRISLTQKGRELRDPLIDISDRLIRKVYKTMPVAERKSLVAGLTKINDGW
jgi:DNA-binding MarR family transcriptional regulator